MLYTKPANIKYTDMCIFFDNNFYSSERDDETCYKYMYLIYHMLACKKKFFHNYEDYDAFAQFSATTIYMRYIKKEQEGLPRIKSILNYAKATVYPLKVMFQKQRFKDIPESDEDTASKAYLIMNQMREQVQCDYNEGLKTAICETLESVPQYITQVVMETPYKNNLSMVRKLSMSCLITLLKGFTLSQHGIDLLNKKVIRSNSRSLTMINKIYAYERQGSVSLWGLSDDYADYIQVLTSKVRRKLSEEISELTNSYTLPVDVVDAILSSAWDMSAHSSNTENSEELE